MLFRLIPAAVFAAAFAAAMPVAAQTTLNVVTAGDHDIVIGEVLHADCLDGEPLVFYSSQYRSLG